MASLPPQDSPFCLGTCKSTMAFSRPRSPVWSVVWFAMPALANAHSAAPGANFFYAGLLHPLQNPQQLLVLLGLGIWLGQSKPFRLTPAMWVFMFFCASSLLATHWIRLPDVMPIALAALGFSLGVLVASAAKSPVWVQVALFGAGSIFLGLDSGVDGTPSVKSLALALIGTWISTSVLLTNIAYYVSVSPQQKWLQIGIRVGGSWIAAACVMMLAFLIKGT